VATLLWLKAGASPDSRVLSFIIQTSPTLTSIVSFAQLLVQHHVVALSFLCVSHLRPPATVRRSIPIRISLGPPISPEESVAEYAQFTVKLAPEFVGSTD
jgi:hypothetical protein